MLMLNEKTIHVSNLLCKCKSHFPPFQLFDENETF